jgi:hypothetical protein
MKTCINCSKRQPDSEFWWKEKGKRREAQCKTCRGERVLARLRGRTYELLCHYSKSRKPKCECCGETNVEFLALDHINRDGAAHRREIEAQRAGWRLRQWLVSQKKLPTDLRVLCHNCNMALSFYGYCPHQERRLIFEKAHTTFKELPKHPTHWKITPEIARQIKQRIAANEAPVKIAEDFGIKPSTVYMIRLGRQWKDA